MGIMEIIGIVGASLSLIAFIMNQMHKWSADDFIFDLFNLVGSAFLLWYALYTNSIPFIITNVVWGGFSLWGVAQTVMMRLQKPAKTKKR